MDHNPFAPPDADAAPETRGGEAGGWRVEGELLLIDKLGPRLPDRCVKCNAPSNHRFARQLQWNPRWVPLTILVCWPVYLVALLSTRKTARVDVGLCDEHERRRGTFQLAGMVGLGLGVAAMVLGMVIEDLVIAGVGFVGLIVGLIALQPSIVLRPVLIDDERGHYKGASPEFLRSL